MLGGRLRPLSIFGVDGGARFPDLMLRGSGLMLRPPEMADFPAWARLRADSRSFLVPWEPLWPDDDLTRPAFRRRLRRYEAEIRADEAYPFLVFDEAGQNLMGGLTLGNVRRGAAQTATLGYWMGAAYAGRGIMTRATRIACRFAFRTLGIERVEAACLPDNSASLHVLEKAGFRHEGFARNYLNIAGQRRDHMLFALLAQDELAQRVDFS